MLLLWNVETAGRSALCPTRILYAIYDHKSRKIRIRRRGRGDDGSRGDGDNPRIAVP